jgi:hypothetical protein
MGDSDEAGVDELDRDTPRDEAASALSVVLACRLGLFSNIGAPCCCEEVEVRVEGCT